MDAPWIALIDDGELDDVRALLEELGMDFVHWRKESFPAEPCEPSRMLITTVYHAVSLRLRRPARSQRGRVVWIAIADTRAHRRYLLQVGFDFLVRRPVHPSALRMLLQCTLYDGDESRRAKRVTVGSGVTCRTGFRRRKATLIDLSLHGCRLLCHHPVERGARVTVRLPSEIAGGRPLDLTGTIVRSRQGQLEGGQPEETSIALRFGRFSSVDRGRLVAVLVSLSSGPASWREKAPDRREEPPPEAAGEASADRGAAKRRREPRVAYGGRVAPLGYPENVFSGRDLSREGLRVAPDPALTVGANLRLVIDGGADAESVVVGAQVVRADQRGAALQFDWVEHGGDARLDAIVASLPRIESLPQGRGRGKAALLANLIPNLLLPRSRSRH